MIMIFSLKFQIYLINLLTGDLSFKCLFANGIVSLRILSILIIIIPPFLSVHPPF